MPALISAPLPPTDEGGDGKGGGHRGNQGDAEHRPVAERMDTAWWLAVFEDADRSRAVELYRFTIDERSGIKHVGLPPELEREYLAPDLS